MKEEIELRHLRYFLAVAETLHFSKAAQMLGIAQPPLSQQIKRLEQLLGHRLFDRTTRGVKLTLAGQLLAERARSTIEKVQDDLAQVRRLGRGEEGTLTVGFSGSVMFTDLPAAIENLSATLSEGGTSAAGIEHLRADFRPADGDAGSGVPAGWGRHGGDRDQHVV